MKFHSDFSAMPIAFHRNGLLYLAPSRSTSLPLASLHAWFGISQDAFKQPIRNESSASRVISDGSNFADFPLSSVRRGSISLISLEINESTVHCAQTERAKRKLADVLILSFQMNFYAAKSAWKSQSALWLDHNAVLWWTKNVWKSIIPIKARAKVPSVLKPRVEKINRLFLLQKMPNKAEKWSTRKWSTKVNSSNDGGFSIPKRSRKSSNVGIGTQKTPYEKFHWNQHGTIPTESNLPMEIRNRSSCAPHHPRLSACVPTVHTVDDRLRFINFCCISSKCSLCVRSVCHQVITITKGWLNMHTVE